MAIVPQDVVAEVFVNNRWEMWDADLEVYYRNHAGVIASVEDLAADPELAARFDIVLNLR